MSSWVSPFPISMLTSQLWPHSLPHLLSENHKVLTVFPCSSPQGHYVPFSQTLDYKDILVLILNLWSHLTYKFILNPVIYFNFLKRSDHFSTLGTRGTLFVPKHSCYAHSGCSSQQSLRNSSMKCAVPSLTSTNLIFIYSLQTPIQ